MLGVSQQRISQLVRSGELIAERDPEGRYQYDRIAAERLTSDRARRSAETSAMADERRALQAEARDRFARQRALASKLAAAREAKHDDLLARAVTALERIASALRKDDR